IECLFKYVTLTNERRLMGRQQRFDADEVIDKVICVFMSKGYEATSVKDLIDATNVHPGSLYNSFGNKKQIYQHALNRYVSTSPFNRLLEDAESGNPKKKLEKLFSDTISMAVNESEPRGCLITNTAAELGGVDPKTSEWVLKSFKKTEDQICRLIERGQELGQFKSEENARKLAQFIFNTTQGIQLLAKVNQDRKMLKGIARTAMNSLNSL
ncbi:MAG: TetR/AcrR family transcriptional regulator, partial [Rhizobiaceae bacterium]